MRSAALLLMFVLAGPLAGAHGDLAINELETLAIRDFEGLEDSFPWEGFEIWDVYVGEGYNETLDSDGVYFKVNFAGDGTVRPTGGKAWTVKYTFKVGEEAFERTFTHDGTTITTTFESLQWTVADGNVLQVKSWVPLASWSGQSVTDLVLLSSVDGQPRDSAPGGVYGPGGVEAPVQGPGTPVFPPIGEGRIVNEIPLTGPGKFLDVAAAPQGEGRFMLTVKNPLKEQGQHVFIYATPPAEWNLTLSETNANLNGGASATFDIILRPEGAAGTMVEPLRIDLVSDIGGRQTYYAVLGASGVELIQDATLAQAGAIPEGAKETPGPTLVLLVAALGLALLASRTRTRR